MVLFIVAAQQRYHVITLPRYHFTTLFPCQKRYPICMVRRGVLMLAMIFLAGFAMAASDDVPYDPREIRHAADSILPLPMSEPFVPVRHRRFAAQPRMKLLPLTAMAAPFSETLPSPPPNVRMNVAPWEPPFPAEIEQTLIPEAPAQVATNH